MTGYLISIWRKVRDISIMPEGLWVWKEMCYLGLFTEHILLYLPLAPSSLPVSFLWRPLVQLLLHLSIISLVLRAPWSSKPHCCEVWNWSWPSLKTWLSATLSTHAVPHDPCPAWQAQSLPLPTIHCHLDSGYWTSAVLSVVWNKQLPLLPTTVPPSLCPQHPHFIRQSQ